MNCFPENLKKDKICTGNERRLDYNHRLLADGVIGNTVGFDPIILGSSPGRPAPVISLKHIFKKKVLSNFCAYGLLEAT